MADTADDPEEVLCEAREEYAEAEDKWGNLQAQALDDMKFGLLGDQWPGDIMQARRTAGRPCMTINRMPAFMRQVVNDGRQNRPGIKVRPQDSFADVQTAEVFSGLIRHIESISDADVAYDTALFYQVAAGFGFITIDVEYACDDTFDKEIKINQVANPLSVMPYAHTEAYDSSDWKYAFISEQVTRDDFDAKYPDKKESGTGVGADKHVAKWFEGNSVRISKYYKKIEKDRKIVLLSNGYVLDIADYVKNKALFDEAGATVVQERVTKSSEIVIRKITGCDILEETRWRGSIIPVIPFWGDSFNIEGDRYANSLIHDAKDAQRIFNFSRSTATELNSLAPKVPYIGKKGSFKSDAEKWATANTVNHPFIEYDGDQQPARQQFSGVPEGSIQEAALASEDMKAIIGMSNPSLGMPDARVISGKAKRMERHEADTGTYHFTDNQHRSIRGAGRGLIELIPQVYSGERVQRILGPDKKPQIVNLGKAPPRDQQVPPGTPKIYDLTVGKYDLSVEAGPSYTTQREEAADVLTSLVQADPTIAPIIAPQLVKMYDMPDNEKITAMLATMMPPAARAIFDGTPMPTPGPSPEIQAQMAADQAKAQHTAQLQTQAAQQEFQLEQQRAQNKQQIEETQAKADIVTMQQKAAAEMQIMRERAQLEFELKREEARLAAELKAMGAIHAATKPPEGSGAPPSLAPATPSQIVGAPA